MTRDHFHYNERTVIGTKEETLHLAAHNLNAIIEWHATLHHERETILREKALNHYILNNRMENIKRVLNVFRESGELDKELATNYAITHMIIEHDFEDESRCTYSNIYNLFTEYIMNTYDCLNSLNGNTHPTSNELIHNYPNGSNGYDVSR